MRLVADERMDDLATTEFVPPKGLEPWQGTVLLRERIDNESVGAWFSGLAARDVITLSRDNGDTVTLGIGEQFETAAPEDREVLSAMFDGRRQIELGSYDKGFATAWRDVRSELEDAIARSGWWKRHTPHASSRLNVPWPLYVVLGLWVLIVFGSVGTAQLGWISSPPGALGLRPRRPGPRRLRRVPHAAARAQRHWLGVRPARGVVPPVPEGE